MHLFFHGRQEELSIVNEHHPTHFFPVEELVEHFHGNNVIGERESTEDDDSVIAARDKYVWMLRVVGYHDDAVESNLLLDDDSVLLNIDSDDQSCVHAEYYEPVVKADHVRVHVHLDWKLVLLSDAFWHHSCEESVVQDIFVDRSLTFV